MQARTIRSKLLPLTAVVLASVLSGCGNGDGPVSDGPMSSASSRHGLIPTGSICQVGGHPSAFGDQTFTNYGNAMVTLDRVVLLHPHHERLVGSFAVPGGQLIGAVRWPPNYPDMPSEWKHRQPVRGFRLAPGRMFNMVLGVAATTSGRATSHGMLVYYHDSAGNYVAKNYFGNIIAAVSQHACR